MVEALLATTPPSLIPAQLIVNEPCAVLTDWPCSAKWHKGLHIAIFRQSLPRLAQSSSLRCSKVACKGVSEIQIGRNLFSSRNVDFWFPTRPASWSPRREGFVYARRALVTSLAGELRRDDSGQVKFDRELRSQVDSAYGARER
jgi:hypothetical protein